MTILSKEPMNYPDNTHLKPVGYVLWTFGFTGSDRFYYGKQTGHGNQLVLHLWLLFVGWIIDFFLIPSTDREADLRYRNGGLDYTVAWILQQYDQFSQSETKRCYN